MDWTCLSDTDPQQPKPCCSELHRWSLVIPSRPSHSWIVCASTGRNMRIWSARMSSHCVPRPATLLGPGQSLENPRHLAFAVADTGHRTPPGALRLPALRSKRHHGTRRLRLHTKGSPAPGTIPISTPFKPSVSWFDISLPARFSIAPTQLGAVIGKKRDGQQRGLSLEIGPHPESAAGLPGGSSARGARVP
jgi:hypothetical protein